MVFFVLFFVFFFKQKTAYEMRISDWSSDVCSSDLIVIEPEGLFGEGDFPSQHLISDRWLCAVDSASPHASQEKISKREFLDLPHAVYGQIGRASCRERVCQYV